MTHCVEPGPSRRRASSETNQTKRRQTADPAHQDQVGGVPACPSSSSGTQHLSINASERGRGKRANLARPRMHYCVSWGDYGTNVLVSRYRASIDPGEKNCDDYTFFVSTGLCLSRGLLAGACSAPSSWNPTQVSEGISSDHTL